VLLHFTLHLVRTKIVLYNSNYSWHQTGILTINTTHRIFIALELPTTLQSALQTQLETLQNALPGAAIRWVAATNVHLTLKFLGDVAVNGLDRVKNATRQAVQACPPFELTAMGMGCFPSFKRPNVVWVGVEGEKAALVALRDQVEAHLAPLGYPTEERPFSPHITLGRVKANTPQELATIGSVIRENHLVRLGTWRCDTISVIESTLTPAGARYTPLGHYPLHD